VGKFIRLQSAVPDKNCSMQCGNRLLHARLPQGPPMKLLQTCSKEPAIAACSLAMVRVGYARMPPSPGCGVRKPSHANSVSPTTCSTLNETAMTGGKQ
jgi:hypothetical protein